MLDALTGGFVNHHEKRYAVATNAVSDPQPGYQSIETYGPSKPGRETRRPDFRAKILDGGKVHPRLRQGEQNVNPRIPLLTDGQLHRAWTATWHDPTGYYVQFELDVPRLPTVDSCPPSARSSRTGPSATEILRTQRSRAPASGGSSAGDGPGRRDLPGRPHPGERDRHPHGRVTGVPSGLTGAGLRRSTACDDGACGDGGPGADR